MQKPILRSLPALLLACGIPIYSVANDAAAPPDEVLQQEGQQKHLPEPEVTIIQRKDVKIEEYRVNGQLRYAKITPTSGPPYYMFDSDGDGSLDTRHDIKGAPVQQWILMRW